MLTRTVLCCLAVLAFCPASQTRMLSGVPVTDCGLATRPEPRLDPAEPLLWDTLWSFPCPGTFGTGVAWDGAHLWHMDPYPPRLYRLSSIGAVETTFNLPSGAGGHGDLTWDGAHLWMADEQSARAFQLDTATGNALRSFRLPDSASGDPSSWGITWDGQHLWHSDYTSPGHIYELDTVSGAVISQFTPPRDLILGIAWDGAYLWGVDIQSQKAYKMVVPGGSVADSFSWPVEFPLGLEWDGSFFWNVGHGAGRIYKLGSGVGLLDDHGAASRTRILSRPEPNPFASRTRLSCSAAGAGIAGAEVLDCRGRQVRSLAPEGRNAIVWDGTDDAGRPSASGVHFVRVRMRDGTGEQRRVLLVRP